MQDMLRAHRRTIIWVIIVVLVLYAVIPQLGIFKHARINIMTMQWSFVLLAAAWTALTYICAAQSYRWLSFKPLRFLRTLIAQLAALFATRIVPAGLGGIGANYAYLRGSKHNPSQAAAVVAVNNTLGMLGNILLLVVAIVLFPDRIPNAVFERHISGVQIGGYIAVFILISLLAVVRYRKRLAKALTSFTKQIVLFRFRMPAVFAAFLASLLLTTANVLALYSCAAALGMQPTLVVSLLVYSFAIVLGTFTPTPGGLGGIEAGLVIGFVAFGMDAGVALAIALLFRIVSNWVPLLIGASAFWYAERHHYFSLSTKR